MIKSIKIVLSVLTLLTALSMLGVSVYGLFLPHYGLAVCCAAIAALMVPFLIKDYKYFFVKENNK